MEKLVINILNPYNSIDLNIAKWFVPDDLPLQEFKYASPKKVLNNVPEDVNELVQFMIEIMSDYDNRSVVVDYKVRNLKAGESGCAISDWHLDCTNDIHCDFEPETHLIYSTVVGTYFAHNQIDCTNYSSVQEVVENVKLQEFQSSKNYISKFTSKVLHRCPVLDHDAQRLLIRVTAGFEDRIKNARSK